MGMNMNISSKFFTNELLQILGESPETFGQPENNPTAFAGNNDADFGGDPVSQIAQRNLIDRNDSIQFNLVNTLETAQAQNNGFDYNQIAGVSGNRFVTREFLNGVEGLAGRLGTRPEYLLAVMSFETGGSFNPAIRNGIGATGLIQFLPSTARGLGTTTDALARMSSTEQLQFVEKYFDQPHFRGKLGSLEGLYTAVLSGQARSNPNDVLFTRGTRAYDQNPLDWNKDGQITAGEAVTPVAARLYGGVRNVQQRLIDVGVVPANQRAGFADGAWGKNTAAAVSRFQQANGLPATGLLDDPTGRKLFALAVDPLPPPPNPNPTLPIPTATMRKGSRGSQVKQLQDALVKLGFMSQADLNTGPGIFGQRTENALKGFQRANGIKIDGVYGSQSRAALARVLQPTTNPPPTTGNLNIPSTTLKEGNRSNDVRNLQDALVRFGYMTQTQMDTGSGIFGSKTDSAVRNFQRDAHLAVDGTFGRQSQTAMRDIISGLRQTGGVKNTNVTKGIQDRMVALGYMTRGEVNTGYGTFGSKTDAAVRRFQSLNNLPQNGIVGIDTFKSLFSGTAIPNNTLPPNNTPGYFTATNGEHYTVSSGVLMTNDLLPRLNDVAGRYFERTGQNLHITSGYRPPSRQASAMYDLIARNSTTYVRNLYQNKSAVDQIISAYRNNSGSQTDAIAAMTRTIESQVGNGVYISSHLRSRAVDFRTTANFNTLSEVIRSVGGSILNEGDHYHVQL